MKLGQIFNEPKKPIDYSDLSALTEQLISASDELSRMSDGVAKAKTIKEFAHDRRKRWLALSTREFIDHESAAAADIKGRASVMYGEALERQEKEYHEAEDYLARYEAQKCVWESLRSAISTWRAVAGNI